MTQKNQIAYVSYESSGTGYKFLYEIPTYLPTTVSFKGIFMRFDCLICEAIIVYEE